MALSRDGRDDAAAEAMAEALTLAVEKGDAALARQARAQLIILWAKAAELDDKVAPLASLFYREPTDIESGRTLAEVQIRLGRTADAERTLTRLARLLPNDADVRRTLERVFAAEGKFVEAVAVLEELVHQRPAEAASLYTRMSDYERRAFRPAEEESYAERAVNASPGDAHAHARLGETYLRANKTDQAIDAFDAAIEKGAKESGIFFKLEELLRAKGETEKAERVLVRVLEGDDDAAIRDATARLDPPIEGSSPGSRALPHLLRLSAARPARAVYLELAIGSLDRKAAPDREWADSQPRSKTEEARSRLSEIARSAESTLLRGLLASPHEQDVATSILSFATNREIVRPLLEFARGGAETRWRARAVRTLGALAVAGSVPGLDALISPPAATYAGDEVVEAATWALSRISSAAAEKLLLRASKEGPVPAEAAAILALADRGDGVRRLVRDQLRAGAPVELKAALAVAAAKLGLDEVAPAVVAAVRDTDPLTKKASLAALATLPLQDETVRAEATELFAEALFWREPRSHEAPEPCSQQAEDVSFADLAAVGLSHISAQAIRPAPSARPSTPTPLATRDALCGFIASTARLPRDKNALVLFKREIRAAWRKALSLGGGERKRALALLDDGAGLAKLFESGDVRSASVLALAASVTPDLVLLTRDDDPWVAATSWRLLTSSTDTEAVAFVRDALSDVRSERALPALRAISSWSEGEPILPVARHLDETESWPVRVAAAETLGRIGRTHGEASVALAASLAKAAEGDSSALVRMAALAALQTFAEGAARGIATKLAHTDPEPRVRHAAAELLLRP